MNLPVSLWWRTEKRGIRHMAAAGKCSPRKQEGPAWGGWEHSWLRAGIGLDLYTKSTWFQSDVVYLLLWKHIILGTKVGCWLKLVPRREDPTFLWFKDHLTGSVWGSCYALNELKGVLRDPTSMNLCIFSSIFSTLSFPRMSCLPGPLLSRTTSCWEAHTGLREIRHSPVKSI